jgi:opacity protein-like surface antigen
MKRTKKILYLLGVLLTTLNFAQASASEKLTDGNEKSPNEAEEITRRNRSCFQKGVQIISVGYGAPNLGKVFFKSLDRLYPTSTYGGIGPLFLRYEYAIADQVGLGISLRYLNTKIEYPVVGPNYDADGNPTLGDSTYNYTNSMTSIGAMVRANYHFSTGRQLDPYIGLGLGYGTTNFKINQGGDVNGIANTVSSPIPIAIEATIGARYFFSESIGAYLELGYSQSLVNGGIAIKF